VNKIGRELKYLSRRELVDIIYQLKKNEQELQQEIEALKEELADKRIRISSAGSIADAAMSVTNVISDAQMTADIYLREITQMKEETEKECAQKIEEAEAKVKDVYAKANEKIVKLKTRYNNDFTKWKQLRTKITSLEQMENNKTREEIENE
jgi:cell division septum initiation protein DivIVA